MYLCSRQLTLMTKSKEFEVCIMVSNKKWFVILFLGLSMMISCQQEVTHLELDAVDSLCNVDPGKALEQLDTYQNVIHRAPKRARMRYDLLQVKAHDKAFIPHTSDSLMKLVLEYYQNHGSVNERLEAMYYMGSVYRDLHDSPRALKWYLEATKYGEEHITEVDSTILRNVYAQLGAIYSYQYDFKNSLETHKREFQLSKDADYDPRTVMDLANGYVHTERKDSGLILYDRALDYILRQKTEVQNIDILAGQVTQLSLRYQDKERAKRRVAILRLFPELDSVYNVTSGLGNYYLAFGPADSAIYFYKKTIASSPDLQIKMGAARNLTHLYGKIGQKDSMYHYTLFYVQLNDSLVRMQQWEQDRIVQNEFEYRRNKQAEEEAYREAAEAKQLLMGCCIAALVVLLILVLIMWERERRGRNTIHHKDKEMDAIRGQLNRTIEENEDLSSRWDMELKKREVVDLDLSEVKESLRRKAAGHNVGKSKRELIKEMFAVVDMAYPDFGTSVRQKIPTISKDDLSMIYMKQLGLSTIEIASIIGLDRSNVHRHLKAIEEKLE